MQSCPLTHWRWQPCARCVCVRQGQEPSDDDVIQAWFFSVWLASIDGEFISMLQDLCQGDERGSSIVLQLQENEGGAVPLI